jgi:hypothetical protein
MFESRVQACVDDIRRPQCAGTSKYPDDGVPIYPLLAFVVSDPYRQRLFVCHEPSTWGSHKRIYSVF